MKIIVYGNEYQGKHLADVGRLLHDLRNDGHTVEVEERFAAYLAAGLEAQQAGLIAPVTATGHYDLALSLGGDGTLLRTARLVHGSTTPVMGLNTGHLGYLTAASLDGAMSMVRAFERGECLVQLRTMLSVTREGETGVTHSATALNEVAILRQDTSSMIEMETSVNGVPLTVYKGDGLVVCTPSGSTAYNMSAGGPIVDPTTACLALTPVSPHSLTMRPLVVRDDAVISITTRSRAPQYQVSVDGDAFVCPTCSTVTINKSPHPLRLVLSRDHNFALTLRHKLLWGAGEL